MLKAQAPHFSFSLLERDFFFLKNETLNLIVGGLSSQTTGLALSPTNAVCLFQWGLPELLTGKGLTELPHGF